MKLSPLVLLLLAPLAASREQIPEPPLAEAAMMRHIAYLADDALEGRAPDSAGGMKAAAYIAGELAAAGLSPGAPGGGWYQPVPLVKRQASRFRQEWRTRGGAVALPPTLTQFSARDGSAQLDRTKVIFAGYGLHLPEQGFDDLAGLDLEGRVVLILSGRPEAAPGAPGLEIRREAIAHRGAAAVIALTAERDPWPIIRAQLDRGRTVAADQKAAPVEGALAYPAWQSLLAAAGQDGEALQQTAGQPGFRARPLALTLDLRLTSQIRPFTSYNVIGRIGGGSASGEAVMLTAHWDHLGLCGSEKAPDRICNGAIDNASGVAELIEVARRLAHGPRPARSIFVAATTAEEVGLLGAKAIVAAPPVPIGKIAAVLNMDTVAIAPKGEPVAIIGRGRTPLDPLIAAAASLQGRTVDTSDAANAFVNRQDGWAFLSAGIPAVAIGGGFGDAARLTAFLTGDYHKPSDDLSRPIALDGAAEDGALHVMLVRMLADPRQFPLAQRSAR